MTASREGCNRPASSGRVSVESVLAQFTDKLGKIDVESLHTQVFWARLASRYECGIICIYRRASI